MRTISKTLQACMLVMLVGVGTAAAQGTSSTTETTTQTSTSKSTSSSNKTKAQGQYGGTSYGGTTSAQATPRTGNTGAYGGTTYGAQTTPTNEAQPQPTYTTEEEPGYESTLERYGVAVMLGGGAADWRHGSLRSDTGIAGTWDVRVALGTRWPVAVELSYIGSAQNINLLGLDSDAKLLGNGAQGVGRINIFDWNIQPFLFGGVAWTHYSLEDTSIRTSAVLDTDDVLEVPAGVGINWKYRGFLLDVRGEYRFAFFDDMFGNLTSSSDMARYGGNANIGYAF